MKKLTERQKLSWFIAENWHPSIIEDVSDEDLYKWCRIELEKMYKSRKKIYELTIKMQQEL